MASNMNKVAKELKNAINASDERKPKPYDTQAEVIRIEDKTAWVHIPGGVDETPVRLTINAKKGDNVNLHVANGTAWITGNSTNPPTDDSTANYAIDISNEVKKDVTVLNTVVAENIEATNARFTNVEADTAKIHDLTADNLHATVGYIEDLTADSITANDISAASGYIKDLTAGNVTAQNVIADHATVGNLDANYAKVNAANINTATIRNAWVDKIMVQTGLLAYSSQIYTLDAIEVNAANITAGTLDVNRLIVTVGEGSSAQKYLVNIDPSTGTPSYEKLDGNIVEPRTITANKIVANSITTDEITVNNLVGTSGWINLHEGKFFYGNGADFATSANAISWNGSKLQIKADEFLLSTGKTIQDSIESVENWFYSVPPTTSNPPASSWTTTNLKEQHLRDIYFDTTSGKSYRWSKEGSTYKWVEIEDVELAALAKDLHDNYPPRSEFTVAPNQIQAVVTSEANARKAIYGTCGTATGTTAKVVTCANFARYTGAVVTVKFTNANTATTPTLNVNSTGAATIKSYKGDALAEAEYKWAAGSTLSFVFDGTYWRLQDSGSTAQIKVNADNINLRVQKNDVINQINVSTEGAQIHATKVDIAGATVFNNYSTTQQMNDAIGTAVDGIEVGGRNILVGTGTSISKATTATSSYVTQILYDTPNLAMLSALGFAVNDEVTLSFDWKITSASTYGNARIEWYGKTSSAENSYIAPLINPFATFSASNTSGHVTKTVKLTSATVQAKRLVLRIDNSNLTLTISNLKLEKGNKATDWSPAPEDVTEYTDTAVNGIEVGGRNLLLDTDAPSVTKVHASANRYWSSTSTTGYTGTFEEMSGLPAYGAKYAARLKQTDNFGTKHFLTWYSSQDACVNLVRGNQYTMSVWCKKVSGSDISIGFQYGASSYKSIYYPLKDDSEWHRYSHTFTAQSGDAYYYPDSSQTRIYIGGLSSSAASEVLFCGYKLEAGNKVTDWTPAPEDVQAEIDAKKSVHTLDTSYSYTYANILTYSAEGYGGTNGANWVVANTAGVKVGDTVRLKVAVSDMSNAPVYVVGTVVKVTDATQIRVVSHGLDTTIIDGGNILTNSIGANQIQANSINTSKLAVGDWTNLVTANELYPDSLPASSVSISNGYLVKTTATNQYILLTKINPRTPNNFKKGDELYVEFYAKAASATTAVFSIFAYDSSNTCLDGNSALINGSTSTTTFNIPTTETKFTGTITLTRPAWDTAAYYEIDLNNNASTKVQIYMRKVVVRKKSNGELIVDGSITSAHISSNKIDANKINVGQIQIGDLSGSIGGVNLLSNDKVRKTGTFDGVTFSTSSAGPEYIKINGTATADVDQWVANLQSITVTGMSVTISSNAVFNNSTGIYFFVSTSKDGAFYKNYKQITYYSATERRLTINLESGETLRYLRIHIPSGSTINNGSYRFKVETGNKQTAWTAAEDAYITDNGNDGIKIHSSLTKDNAIVLSSAGMEIFKGGDTSDYSIAKYGDTVRIGKDANQHVYIGPGSFSIGKGANNARQYMNVFMMDGHTPGGTEITGAYYAFSLMGPDVDPPSDSLFGFVLGYLCEATGFCAKSMGAGTVVHYDYQTAIGKYNANDSANAFEIGWGTSSSNTKNIFEVDVGGNVNIASSRAYKVNGTVVASARAKTTITPTASGVSNYSNYGNSYYEKAGNVVHVHIGVKGVTTNTVVAIATLPTGYRPTSMVFGHGTGGSSDNIGYMDISTAGVIQVRSATGYVGADVTYLV